MTSASRCCLRLAPLLVRARSFFSEDRSAGVSWDAGAGACLSDLFSDILTSHLIIRFCLASSSDLCSSVFLKDVTSSRRASALRFASWSCSCKKDICCCNNAIISSFFILQRYEKRRDYQIKHHVLLMIISLVIRYLQARSCQCSASCDILQTSAIFRPL